MLEPYHETPTHMTSQQTITITGPDFEYEFDAQQGTLSSLRRDGEEFLQRGPLLNVWRTPIDNEEVDWGDSEAAEWYQIGLDQLEHDVEAIEATEVTDSVTRVTIETFVSAPDSDAGFATEYLYHVLGTGDVLLGVRTVANDALRDAITHWLPKVGLQLEVPDGFEEMTWYGHGPQETYPDRNNGTKVGTYSGNVEDQYVPYVRPQDYGNKTEVRWSELSTNAGVGLAAFGYPDINVSAHTVANLDRALFEYQLEERDGVLFNLDHAVTGVGGTPVQTLPEYRVLLDDPFEFVIGLRPRLEEDSALMQQYRRNLPYAFASTDRFGTLEVSYDVGTATISVSTVIRNPDSEQETIEVPLLINDEIVSTKEIPLSAGEKTEVAFEYEPNETGSIKIAIGNSESEELTISS